MNRTDGSVPKRVWAKIDVREQDECWPWKGSKRREGHGQLWVAGTTVAATRLLWVSIHGPVPRDRVVMHKCDNPPCMNPKHLQLGTNHDNVLDAQRKGRLKGRARRKLKAETRREIGRLRASGLTQREVAEQFGVNPRTVAVWTKRYRESSGQE